MVSRELLREFKESGCLFMMYGFETASPRLQRECGKNLDLAHAGETMRAMKELKLRSYGLFMLGFPGETEAEARATIDLAKKLDFDVVSFGRVTPYPGSALYERYRADFEGKVPSWQWNNQYRPRKDEPGWELPGLSSRQITRLLSRAMTEYYLRPRMILRHLWRRTFSFSDMARGGFYALKDLVWRAFA